MTARNAIILHRHTVSVYIYWIRLNLSVQKAREISFLKIHKSADKNYSHAVGVSKNVT